MTENNWRKFKKTYPQAFLPQFEAYPRGINYIPTPNGISHDVFIDEVGGRRRHYYGEVEKGLVKALGGRVKAKPKVKPAPVNKPKEVVYPKVVNHDNDGNFPMQLSLISNVKYNIPAEPFAENLLPDIGPFITTLKIYVSQSESFTVKLRELFYVSPKIYYSGELARKWFAYPTNESWAKLQNFAVWCATTGCGVSYSMLVDDGSSGWPPMVSAFLRFHVAFTVRRILFEAGGIQGGVALPGDSIFDRGNVKFDKPSYNRICREFGIDEKSDFVFRGAPNGGLGDLYVYGTYSGYYVPLPLITTFLSKD